MFGGTGYIHRNMFSAEAIRRGAELRRVEEERAREARRAHRSLPARARVLKELLGVLDRLKFAAKLTPREVARQGGEAVVQRRTDRWLRQYRRLNRILDSMNESC